MYTTSSGNRDSVITIMTRLLGGCSRSWFDFRGKHGLSFFSNAYIEAGAHIVS